MLSLLRDYAVKNSHRYNVIWVIPMDKIITYIKDKYSPLAIIVYGSFANGTNNLNSDFDALVVTANNDNVHDTSFVDDVQLDVFVYPKSYFDKNYDCSDFIQILDGKIIMDTDEIGERLINSVLSYMENRPRKSQAEIKADLDWCVKMCERVKRNDAEGMFRFHWLLVDSLEIYCNALHHTYLGPKKSLKWMEENHPKAFACYQKALFDFSVESLSSWVAFLSNIV